MTTQKKAPLKKAVAKSAAAKKPAATKTVAAKVVAKKPVGRKRAVAPPPVPTVPAMKRAANTGTISLIAVGAGDPELMTQRGRVLLEAADAVVIDPNVSDIARLYAPTAVLVEVEVDEEGNVEDHSTRVKRAIEVARDGRNVVRLLEGDATLDGAFQAEVNVLHRAKLPFELVPGVSVATGLSAYGGFPLTDDKAEEVRVVTVDQVEDWAVYADPANTLIVTDGAERAVEIAKALIAAGRKPDTPMVVTRASSTVDQLTFEGTLGTIGPILKASKLTGPGLVAVGEVIGARAKMSWFETKPLFGWRVLVPRTKEASSEVCDMLRAYGAVPIEVPTISVEPPRTPQQMDRAIQGVVSGRYQWIGFTSVNSVRAIREKFEAYGLDARSLAGLKIAAVGEATVASLIEFGIKPDLITQGEQSTAELLAQWPNYDAEIDPIDRVFLPRADVSTEALAAGLEQIGWEVDDIVAYRTVRAAPPPAETREAIKTGGFDAVLFTSSSTVRNLVGIAGKPHTCTIVAAIGPATADTVKEHGLRVDVRPEAPEMQLFIDSLAEYAEGMRLAAIENGLVSWRPSLKRAGSRRRKKAKAL